MSLIFLFLSLCLSCSAVELNYIKELTHYYPNNAVRYIDSRSSVFSRDNTPDEVRERCQNECLESKYICKAFILTNIVNDGMLCELFAKPIEDLVIQAEPSHLSLELYNLDLEVKPVIARFSHDHQMSEEEWEDDLYYGYRLDMYMEPMRDVVRICNKAIHGTPSKAIDFEKWTTEKVPAQFVRRSSQVNVRKMLEKLSSWDYFAEEGNAPDTLGDVILAFLDIICPAIRPNINTHYDPVRKILFIDGGDRHILVAAFGPGDYAVVQDKSPSQEAPEKPVIMVTTTGRTTPNRNVDLVQLFNRAMKRLDPSSHFEDTQYKPLRVSNNSYRFNVVVHTVIQALLRDKHYATTEYFPSGTKFYKDFAYATLVNVYRNHATLFNSQVAQSEKATFRDVSIITHE